MIEKRFSGQRTSIFFTEEYHVNREAAHHLEQYETHRPRLIRAYEIIKTLDVKTIVDLGCGDGGLLSLLTDYKAWGYDFCPDNVKYATEVRGVNTTHSHFVDNIDSINTDADLGVLTEVLEHLEEPHLFLKRLHNTDLKSILCSSPWGETDLDFVEGHVWAWDREGYYRMVQDSGWNVVLHEDIGANQIIMAVK